MAKTDPINTANPAGSSDPTLGDDYIRTLARAIIEILQKDHYTGSSSPYNEDAAGEHAKITLNAPLAAHPTNEASKGHVYLKDVSAIAELFFQDENGKYIQISKYLSGLTTQSLLLDSGRLSNATFLKAVNAAGDGVVDLFKATTSDVIEAGAVITLKDTSKLATSGAPAAEAQIANKKYVDDQITLNIPVGDAPTSTDSESNTMLKAHAYKAQTAGFVNATITYPDRINLYVDDTADPAGVGDKVAVGNTAGDGAGSAFVMAFVPKNQYFEVTTNSGTPAIFWTPLISGGAAPIDQD